MAAPTFTPIPAFTDNYIWMLDDGAAAVVVDPGDAGPVQAALRARRLRLAAILITHHHPDHVGGLPALLRETRVPVYGPRAEAPGIPGLSHPLADGDSCTLAAPALQLAVWAVPGHTLGHIAYVGAGFVLCGDTLFSAGCGRLFEGTAEQLYGSLGRLAGLPAETAVYCTHEYTQANLAFARAVEDGNADVRTAQRRVAALRQAGRPSLPSSIGQERRINPFLRTAAAGVRAAAERHAGHTLSSETEVFATLRRWKDRFVPPPADQETSATI